MVSVERLSRTFNVVSLKEVGLHILHKKRDVEVPFFVIRKGLEPLTRSLEGCCSNPTELPNHHTRQGMEHEKSEAPPSLASAKV